MLERSQGRTRWIVGPIAGLGLACLALFYQMASTGAMAVGFTTSDTRFKVYSNYLEGVVAAGFLSPNKGFTGTSRVGVTELGIKTARAAGLCMVATETHPFVGTMTMVITAGVPVKGAFGNNATFSPVDGTGAAISMGAQGELTGSSLSEAVSISDLYLNATNLSAYGRNVAGMDLGRSADTVAAGAGISPWPSGQNAPVAGAFGLGINRINLGDFSGGSFGVDMKGAVKMKYLKMRIYRGTFGQAMCQTQATAP